ncbi:MAG TPA: hypothetical protein VE665_05045 [Hyphomicrobiaceae bacterium]|jgi:iron(III) transport system substrate-binding protein|nr:hypothetical protein [Hyphomicrobiaceae bacterium]
MCSCSALSAVQLFAGLMLTGSFPPSAAAESVDVSSHRESSLIDPLLKAFTESTGIKTNVVFAQAGLNERLAAEGQNSAADALLTVDIARLTEAKEASLAPPVASRPLADNISQKLHDSDGHWFAILTVVPALPIVPSP